MEKSCWTDIRNFSVDKKMDEVPIWLKINFFFLYGDCGEVVEGRSYYFNW